MANLTKAQIDELKEKGLITQVIPSDDLASKTVDELKNEKYVTVTDPSADIEADITHDIPVEGISIPQTLDMDYSSGTGSFTVIFTPENATNKNVTVNISDPSIVDIETYLQETQEVRLIAGDLGSATITVTTEDGGFTAECLVNVINPVIPVEGIEINKKLIEPFKEGNSLEIHYSTIPYDATNQNVTMESSDESVFTVQYNDKKEIWEVYGVSGGSATLTVTTEDGGFADTAEIIVIGQE